MSTLNDEDRENLTAYLDGELDEEASHALEAKINLDPEVRKEVEALKQAWGLLDYLPKPPPATGFTNRTMERLSLEKMSNALQTGRMARQRVALWGRVVGWAAVIALAAGLGIGAGHILFPKTRDGADPDEPLVHHLRVVEKWRHYDTVEDLDFLRALENPDLFGDDHDS